METFASLREELEIEKPMKVLADLKEFTGDQYASQGNMTKGLFYEDILSMFEHSNQAFEWCHSDANKDAFLQVLSEMSNFTKAIQGSAVYLSFDGERIPYGFTSIENFSRWWKKEWYEAVDRYDFPSLLKVAYEDGLNIYRVVSIPQGGEVDYEHLGHCWSFEREGVYNFEAHGLNTGEGRDIEYIDATTTWDNIDWIKSVILASTKYNDEYEVRILDDSKIEIVED